MKKNIFIILLIVLLFFLYFYFKSNKCGYCVYVESINSEYLKRGNGVVYKSVDNNYYILTLYHIIESSDEIFVTNKNGERKKANLLYYDDYKDIAVLSIKNIKLNVINKIKCDYSFNDKVSILGFSSGKLLKKPGIITGENVQIDIPNKYGNSNYSALKLDSNVDFGDSGSVVLDKNNNLIALISVKDTDSKHSYGIPICDALNIVSLLEKGKINRPNLKATVENSKDVHGITVYNINSTSFLTTLGIKENDIITKVNNVDINNISEFRNELFKLGIGDEICLEFNRKNNYSTACGLISN